LVQIIKRKIVRRRDRRGWAKYDAQEEPGDGPAPDIRRPPLDSDLPDVGDDEESPAAPPFTGEDVEPQKPDGPPLLPI
jgi:hypothetical protein